MGKRSSARANRKNTLNTWDIKGTELGPDLILHHQKKGEENSNREEEKRGGALYGGKLDLPNFGKRTSQKILRENRSSLGIGKRQEERDIQGWRGRASKGKF